MLWLSVTPTGPGEFQRHMKNCVNEMHITLNALLHCYRIIPGLTIDI